SSFANARRFPFGSSTFPQSVPSQGKSGRRGSGGYRLGGYDLIMKNIRGKKWIFSLVLIAGLLIVFEGLCFGSYLVIRQKYLDVRPSRETFVSNLREQYEAPHFDERTGWLNPRHATDPDGSRISPHNPAAVAPCLSMYGGSFVFGSEMSDEHSWG